MKNVVESRLGVNARSTILGHVQRGGPPSAYDRYQGTILGYEAIKTLNKKIEPVIIGLDGYKISVLPMMEAIANTKKIPKLISERKYDLARKLRGSVFQNCLDIYKVVHLPTFTTTPLTSGKRVILVLNCGASSPGFLFCFFTIFNKILFTEKE